MRALNAEEEERLSSTANNFIAAVKELKEIGGQIDEYASSGTEDELANFDQKLATFREKAKTKSDQVREIQPQLAALTKAVDDQERHKKNLKENIELIGSKQRIGELEKEIDALERKASTVDGHDTVFDDMSALKARKEGFMKSTARLEGRRGEVLESIRSIKRKLSADEYKNVDEQFRVEMIKFETTQVAVKDLDKYYTALDKVRQVHVILLMECFEL